MATIDVLLPVRNGLPFLTDAIDSIRAQTFHDWRLIVLDHGSQDGSVELVQQYAENDRRIKFLSFPDADGLAELLNLGLERCDCKYILRQDADDISVGDRMSKTSDLFRDNPELAVIGGDAIVIDSVGRHLGYLQVPASPLAIRAASFFYNPMLHSTVAINFSAFERLGVQYGKDIMRVLPSEEAVRIRQLAEDYLLFGQLAQLAPCANINTPLIKYRQHRGSEGVSNPFRQIEFALQVSRFLANSFAVMKDLRRFDPVPFCNHAEYVFDLGFEDYSSRFREMALTLRQGFGQSSELERELTFRWILATRKLGPMAARYLRFHLDYIPTPRERRTVRNWLVRRVRKDKYIYRVKSGSALQEQ